MAETYMETFNDGAGGWYIWLDNFKGAAQLEMNGHAIVSRAPWDIDYNHCHPGGGYMHLLFCLELLGPLGEMMCEAGGGCNRFIEGGYSTNLTEAQLSVRIKGELEKRGSELCLNIQGSQGTHSAAWALSGQPISVTPDWTWQTITLTADERQWTFMGSRHDRTDHYCHIDLKTVLADPYNIILMLLPVNVVPMGSLDGDMHKLRPEYDYPVWHSKLPDGYVMIDEVKIEYS